MACVSKPAALLASPPEPLLLACPPALPALPLPRLATPFPGLLRLPSALLLCERGLLGFVLLLGGEAACPKMGVKGVEAGASGSNSWGRGYRGWVGVDAAVARARARASTYRK
eukprot:989753-Pelagomonas_calceolata.AAC.4